MINNADVMGRLASLIGKEMNSENLHEALFCEQKHQKIRRRFQVGTHTYLQYKLKMQEGSSLPSFTDISISGNPNTFRIGVEEKNGQIIINSEPRISYSYL